MFGGEVRLEVGSPFRERLDAVERHDFADEFADRLAGLDAEDGGLDLELERLYGHDSVTDPATTVPFADFAFTISFAAPFVSSSQSVKLDVAMLPSAGAAFVRQSV